MSVVKTSVVFIGRSFNMIEIIIGKIGIKIPNQDRIIYIDNSINWELVYAVRKKVRKIFDFNCQIKNGKCGHSSAERLCCHSCEKTFGYLRRIEENKLEKYLKLYNKKTGFWTKKGCKLPDELRSTTCLAYNCNNMDYAVRNFLQRQTGVKDL
jgi:hypothetical protein